MQARDFCYWLQGYFEIYGNQPFPPEPARKWNLNDAQIDMIRNHLALVFKHEIDPSMGDKKHQDKLNETHGGSLPQQDPLHMIARC